jgi:hypothetical protein
MAAAKLEFNGTAAELLAELTTADERRPHGWPKAARSVTTILKRNAPALRKAGWVVDDAMDLHTGVTKWVLAHPEKVRNSSQHSQHSQDDAGKAGEAGNEYTPSQDDERANTYGTCAVCGEPMLIVEAGQTTHPNCDSEGARHDSLRP